MYVFMCKTKQILFHEIILFLTYCGEWILKLSFITSIPFFLLYLKNLIVTHCMHFVFHHGSVTNSLVSLALDHSPSPGPTGQRTIFFPHETSTLATTWWISALPQRNILGGQVLPSALFLTICISHIRCSEIAGTNKYLLTEYILCLWREKQPYVLLLVSVHMRK